MRPQAHVAASLVVWGSGPRPLWEAPVCALCGNLPDLDRSVARALGVKRRDHHRWVSHSLLGWGPPSIAALRWARRSRHGGPIRRGVVAVWIHLAMDTYADGIAWLWPLHRDKLGLFRKPEQIRDAGWRTPAPLDTNVGRIEVVLWLLALAGALRAR